MRKRGRSRAETRRELFVLPGRSLPLSRRRPAHSKEGLSALLVLHLEFLGKRRARRFFTVSDNLRGAEICLTAASV